MAGCGEGCGDDEKNAGVERTRVPVETDINALAIGNNTMARSKRKGRGVHDIPNDGSSGVG